MLPTVSLNYLTESNLLTAKQFGLRIKLLTEVALAHVWHRVLEKRENGMNTVRNTLTLQARTSHLRITN